MYTSGYSVKSYRARNSTVCKVKKKYTDFIYKFFIKYTKVGKQYNLICRVSCRELDKGTKINVM